MLEVEHSKVQMKGNLLSPLPIAIIGALVNNKPNYMVVGYICPFDFGRYIFMSLYKKRYTRIGIEEHGTFSVNIPSTDLLEETNICGSQSGRDLDKSSLFDTFYGELQTAPMIRQCPITIECEVHEVLDYDPNEGIIGRVVQSYVDQQCTKNGKLDMRSVHPMIWVTGGDYNFYQLGDRLPQTKL
ncbi:MAG: flavin reductase family protein [Candidatus Kariarchaeaceae archaeon]|jgi:flavin reductase (DIM6/NTAB) family NADH-FMN oxidoreductase RutF